MQRRNSQQPIIEYNIEPDVFIELYNKSVGMICKEYIGKYIVIYSQQDKEDVGEVVNFLSDIKNPCWVKELYIEGLIITNKNIFKRFWNLEHIHGVPILEITNMNNMFKELYSLKSIEDLGEWDMSNVTQMSSMFSRCESLTDVGDLSGWNTSNVRNMSYMFSWCTTLTEVGDIGGWDVSNVTNMSCLFHICESLKVIGDLGGWDIHSCTTMYRMFSKCKLLEYLGNLGGWNTSNVRTMRYMFSGCDSLKNTPSFWESTGAGEPPPGWW